MKYHIRHRTRYNYSEFASQSHNYVCLQPRDTREQKQLYTQIDITPTPETQQRTTDIYGNINTRFSLSQQHMACDIVVSSLIDTAANPGPLPESLSIEDNLALLDKQSSDDALMAHDCLLASPYISIDTVLDAFIEECPAGQQSVLNYADQLMQHIFKTFSYTSGFSTLITPLSVIYNERKGVCQDFAHLAIAALRRQHIPARYVSGYLETLPPPGEEKLQGADASHAWFSVYDAQWGWFDFDPTNNKRPDSQYITTAWGRDYADVTPVKGVVYGGGTHLLTVEVDVTRSGSSLSVVKD